MTPHTSSFEADFAELSLHSKNPTSGDSNPSLKTEERGGTVHSRFTADVENGEPRVRFEYGVKLSEDQHMLDSKQKASLANNIHTAVNDTWTGLIRGQLHDETTICQKGLEELVGDYDYFLKNRLDGLCIGITTDYTPTDPIAELKCQCLSHIGSLLERENLTVVTQRYGAKGSQYESKCYTTQPMKAIAATEHQLAVSKTVSASIDRYLDTFHSLISRKITSESNKQHLRSDPNKSFREACEEVRYGHPAFCQMEQLILHPDPETIDDVVTWGPFDHGKITFTPVLGGDRCEGTDTTSSKEALLIYESTDEDEDVTLMKLRTWIGQPPGQPRAPGGNSAALSWVMGDATNVNGDFTEVMASINEQLKDHEA